MIMAAPRAKQVAGSPPEQPTIEELRKRYGTDDDDELILRALVPEPDLKKMREAGPVKRDFPLLSSTELDQVQKVDAHRQISGRSNSYRDAVARPAAARDLGRRKDRCGERSSLTSYARRSDEARPGGALVGLHPVDLYAQVLRALVQRTGVDPALIEDVITGCVIQVAEQSGNIGRQAVLAAGFPESRPRRNAGSKMRFGAAGVRLRRSGHHCRGVRRCRSPAASR